METTRVLQERAKQGDANALFRLGYRLSYGRTRPRPTNWRKVVSLWERAARKGHPRAQFYLGVCYDNGQGVSKDLQSAVRWYRRAAKQGHSTDTISGVAIARAMELARMGESQDSCSSKQQWLERWKHRQILAICITKELAESRTIKKAVYWYRLAARQHDAKAQYNLGLCYLDGDGLNRSNRWAKHWFSRAGAQGHKKAKRELRQLAVEQLRATERRSEFPNVPSVLCAPTADAKR